MEKSRSDCGGAVYDVPLLPLSAGTNVSAATTPVRRPRSGRAARLRKLKDTATRVIPYWEGTIVPVLARGARIILSAHGNSLRSLVKHLDNIPDEDVPALEIPTGKPLVYEFSQDLKPTKHYYL